LSKRRSEFACIGWLAMAVPTVRLTSYSPQEIDLQLDGRKRLAFRQGGGVGVSHRRISDVCGSVIRLWLIKKIWLMPARFYFTSTCALLLWWLPSVLD
jgi:hypothetical protein